jgi:hypothetical protein
MKLNVYLAIDPSDPFGLEDALRVIGIKTPMSINLVDQVDKARFLIYAKHDADHYCVTEAQRNNIPVIIIGNGRLGVLAEQIGATHLPTSQYDWSRLYDAIDGALASYPLSYDGPANQQTSLAA